MGSIGTWVIWARGWTVQAWSWVSENYQPLTLMVTLLGVIAAFRYVRLTYRLAEQAKIAAESSKVQVEAALKQASASLQGAEASRKGAEASAEQAKITRQIFEAAHRPYLQVEMDREYSFFYRPDRFRLAFTLKNHGPVPAILAERQVRVKVEGELVAERPAAPTEPDRALFASDEELPLRFENIAPGGSSTAGQPAGVEVDCAVGYRGLNNVPYVTRIVVVSLVNGGWRYTVVEVK